MELKDAVKMAIDNEVKGRTMYMDFGLRAKNSVTKRTFEFLSEEENRHIEKIKKITEALDAGLTEIPELEATSLDKMKEIFGISVKEFDKEASADTNDLKAHELAMDFEKKSFDFYKELAETSTDENVKMFFDSLKKEEEDHYEFIEKAHNFVKDPNGFFAEEEGWLLEG